MIKGRIGFVLTVLALVTAACGAGTDSVDEPTTTRTAEEAPVTSLEPVEGAVEPFDPGADGETDPGAPLPEQPAAKIPRALQPFADAAVADLTERLGVSSDSIAVARAEFVVWPDGSLGCPEPGMAYAQVESEGTRAVLVHGQDTYFYHGGEGRPGPFLCEHLES